MNAIFNKINFNINTTFYFYYILFVYLLEDTTLTCNGDVHRHITTFN